MKKFRTLEEVLTILHVKHGDRYDYTGVSLYKNAKMKIAIGCKIHGKFFQSLIDHIKGRGCFSCGNLLKGQSVKLSWADWLKVFRKKHGFKYDYSKFIYINGSTKGIIICQEHGEFSQSPSSHKKRPCPSCSLEHHSGLRRMSLKEFIRISNLKHNYMYDYSLVSYKGSKVSVDIICKTHGVFSKRPYSHIQGQGCPKCERKIFDTASFIDVSNKKHNYMYDYSLSVYVNSGTKLIIVCNKHGEFLQTPNNHVNGQGCPTCRTSKGEREISRVLDFLEVVYIKQKTFDGCVSDKEWKLRFDFYLPDYNLCVEFDGIQHNNEKSRWFSTRLINNDAIKNNYCSANNISLLRIPYRKMNKIEVILKEFLCI